MYCSSIFAYIAKKYASISGDKKKTAADKPAKKEQKKSEPPKAAAPAEDAPVSVAAKVTGCFYMSDDLS